MKTLKSKKKMTQAQDDAYDRKNGIKKGSKRDMRQDIANGVKDKKKRKFSSNPNMGKTGQNQGMAKLKRKVVKQQVVAHKTTKKKAVKTSGKFGGKSNALGQGGRAAQLRAQGVPGGVIGNLARAAQAAPGQANYHKGKKAKKANAKTAYMKRVSPSKKK